MRLDHAALVTALAATLCCAACISRAPTPESRRAAFDRDKAAEALMEREPAPRKRAGAIFGDAIELVGVDWSPELPKKGEKVSVTFYYRATDLPDDDYMAFVHAESRGNKGGRIGADHWIAKGLYPTSAWQKNDLIRDEWSLGVPSNFRGTGLELWTGLYRPGKEDRLPLTNRSKIQNDGNNRAMVAFIPVE